MQADAQVVNKETGDILFRCSMDEIDKAYDYINSLSELGLDLELKTPSIHESLASALGKEADWEKYEKSLESEIEDHLPGCCFEESKDS